MKIIVIYNNKSGSYSSLHHIKTLFEECDIHPERYFSLKEATLKSLSPFIKRNCVIAVIGGDGTQNSIVHLLKGSDFIYAPLPGGTLNHFCKDAGIGTDLPTAIKQLPDSHKQKVDVAYVNDRVILNNSSLGLYPNSLRARSGLESHIGKWPAAFFATVRTLIVFHTFNVIVNDKSLRTPSIFVGNNLYEIDGSFTRKRLNSGKLFVWIITADSRRKMIRSLFDTLLRRSRTDTYQLFTTQSITIESRKKSLRVATDGEYFRENTPLHYSVSPGKLTILSPKKH